MHFNAFNDHLPLADLLSLKLYCTLSARFGIPDNDRQKDPESLVKMLFCILNSHQLCYFTNVKKPEYNFNL